MDNRIFIKLTEDRLSLDECYQFVQDNSCGGLALFVGTVRNNTENKEVKALEFSSYEPMAVKEMKLIAEKALELFGIERIAIHHAIGNLEVGEVPVIISV